MSSIVDHYSEQFLKVDNLSSDSNTNVDTNINTNNNVKNKDNVKNIEPVLRHYQSTDKDEHTKTYFRVVISMQILTFSLLFIIYLLVWRRSKK